MISVRTSKSSFSHLGAFPHWPFRNEFELLKPTMARRKKGKPIHGWLVLDKPAGLTSTQALARAKRFFQARKAGHAGTLDPLATGVLPIAFGEATKTVPYTMDGLKAYTFGVRWGQETNTDDCEGDVVASSAARPEQAAIIQELSAFVGEIAQTPPAFSAVKINGERAYKLARRGEDVTLKARDVSISSLKLTAITAPDTATFEVLCGKGTYVRALARDLGRRLGCYGHIIELRRTKVGPFAISQSVTLEELEARFSDGDEDALLSHLQPIECALDDMQQVRLEPAEAALLARGQPVLIRSNQAPPAGQTAYAMSKGKLIALGDIERGALHPFRVFNYSS